MSTKKLKNLNNNNCLSNNKLLRNNQIKRRKTLVKHYKKMMTVVNNKRKVIHWKINWLMKLTIQYLINKYMTFLH